MAYTTSQYIQNLQVESITFIPPVSSGYALYINAVGQTYWAPGLELNNLYAFSTTVYTYIQTNNAIMQSTLTSLSSNYVSQSSSLQVLNQSLSQLNSSVTISISSLYNNTIAVMNSTLYGFSTFSSFYTQIDSLNINLTSTIQSLQWSLSSQNTSTTQLLISSLGFSIQSTIQYIDSNISTIRAIVSYKNDFNSFSSLITTQLLSTSAGQINNTSTSVGLFYSGTNSALISSYQNNSTIQSALTQIQALQLFSSGSSMTTYSTISSYVQINQSTQNSYIYKSLSSLSTAIGMFYNSTNNSYTNLSSFVYSSITAINNVNSNTQSLQTQLASLTAQFNTFTTTGVLASVYSSFMQLEEYTFELVTSTVQSVSAFKSSLYYSTSIQNMSISKYYYNSFVSSVYTSTISTLVPIVFSSLYTYGTITLASTLTTSFITSSATLLANIQKSTITSYSTFVTSSATLLANIQTSTNTAYNTFILSTNKEFTTFIESLDNTLFLSSFYTNTVINLHDNNYNAVLDLGNFRNFNIYIYNITNNSNYSISYDPTILDGYNYMRGIITINVSTMNNPVYTKNNGKLDFDVYRWGIPTTIWGNFFPTISKSDYSIHYEYTIINRTLYTNLINVYPTLAVSYIRISSITAGGTFPNGGNLQVSWSNYSGISSSMLGAPFDPTVSIETYKNSIIDTRFGPYPFNSTAIIQSPANILQTNIIVRITGLRQTGFITSTIKLV